MCNPKRRCSERRAYFLPLAQSEAYDFVPRLFILTRDDPKVLIPTIRRLFQEDSNLPAADVRSLSSQLEHLFAPWRLAAFAFTAIGLLATVVAFSGLFSVQALNVTDSEREYAIRSALGAQTAQILGSVVERGLFTVLHGIVAGTIVIFIASRWIQPMLFRTTLADLWSLGVVACLLLVTGTAASYPAARRAMQLHPMDILRG
jgi:putative ABC transport system permease protein